MIAKVQGPNIRDRGGPAAVGIEALQGAASAITRLTSSISPKPWRFDDFWINFGWLVTTSLAMIVCYLGKIPNATAFLLIAVMHSAFAGGYRTGLASASLATLYSSIYFSTPDQLFHYSNDGFRGLLGLAVASYGTVLLTMHLRRRDLSMAQAAAEQVRNRDIGTESEARFLEFADAAPVPIWMADAHGNRVFFNKPWLEFTGKPLQTHVGEGWHTLLHPEDLEWVTRRYAANVKNSERFDAEYRVRSKDGEYRWVQDFGAPRIGPGGVCIGYIGSCVDRTERKRVERALHQLSGKLLGLQDEERRRISRELHDTTAQNLAVLSMNLCVVKEAAKDLAQRTRDAVSESLALAEQCSQEIRTLSYVLHPPLLDELGLVSALRAYTTGFTQRTGIAVEMKMSEIGRLPGEIETTLFRIVQEALTNVHRHSGSLRAEIRMVRDPQLVRLQVMDEGKGVPEGKFELISEGASVGVGIAGMRERAIQLGGQLKVASSARGTTITAILPLKGNT